MAGGDVAGGGFGEEGLVGHVRPGVDDGDGRLSVTHLLQNASSRVQAYVPTAYYEDPGTLRGAHAIEYPPASGGSFVRPFTRTYGVCVTLPGPRDRGHGARRFRPGAETPRQDRVSCRSDSPERSRDPLPGPFPGPLHNPLLNTFKRQLSPQKGQRNGFRRPGGANLL
ncbi:hypothetical protein GCM10018772_32850 [Streptomyces fumanus]|uniref:Uncharacterized protein n=1 Tax=Streptomyces fumanus TaxID=67302 RepID=A0A919E277_9ACTN|nr:hypothetical protein GCM10018772_32850 [Streptomyces fumanus]